MLVANVVGLLHPYCSVSSIISTDSVVKLIWPFVILFTVGTCCKMKSENTCPGVNVVLNNR